MFHGGVSVIAQGGIVTLLGMTVVFGFLGVLVGALWLLAAATARLSQPGVSDAATEDRRVVAAIAAAYVASSTEGAGSE